MLNNNSAKVLKFSKAWKTLLISKFAFLKSKIRAIIIIVDKSITIFSHQIVMI